MCPIRVKDAGPSPKQSISTCLRQKSEDPTMAPDKSGTAIADAPAKKGSISPADPCTIVIFGASGDLSRRKLIPALYSLAAQNCLARRFAIIGFARTSMADEAF